MFKAFRDTWELGIHSYLTYLRDRLLLAKELLSESGSVFVQIGDENLDHVREILDDVFGAENFVSVITFKKTAGQTSLYLPGTTDFIIWYAKDPARLKFRTLFRERAMGDDGSDAYTSARLANGSIRRLAAEELSGATAISSDVRPFRYQLATSQREGRPSGEGSAMHFPVRLKGEDFYPTANRGWTATSGGMERLVKAGRMAKQGANATYVRYLDDFPAIPITNFWADTQSGSGMDKVYVVQTSQKIIERCLLMTTDPGDLVLDPTCGSATTAFVAEKWGRRWPVLTHYLATGDAGAFKLSDFLSVRDYHALPLDKHLYHELQYEDQFAFMLFPPGSELISVALSRARRNFIERDRPILNLVRPYVARAYRHVEQISRITHALHESEPRHGDMRVTSILLDDRDRPIQFGSEAQTWINHFFPERPRDASRLPERVTEWLRGWRDADGSAPLTQRTEMWLEERSGDRLRLRVIPNLSGTGRILVLGLQNNRCSRM